VVALCIWGLKVFFPGPEKAIQKNLTKFAEAVSFDSNEGNLMRVADSQTAVSLCTTNIEISLELSGYPPQSLSGRAELSQGLMLARTRLASLQVTFLDINISVAPSKESAEVDLTARGRSAAERDNQVMELKFTMRRVGGKWLIRKIETVKTLSHRVNRTDAAKTMANGRWQMADGKWQMANGKRDSLQSTPRGRAASEMRVRV
jgi:hypothetical protein